MMEGKKKNRVLLFAYFEVLSNSKLHENVAKENNECQKQHTKLHIYYDQNIIQTCIWKKILWKNIDNKFMWNSIIGGFFSFPPTLLKVL